MDQPRKVAFYIRVSTERQAKVEEGSLKNQDQILRAELDRRNIQRKGWGAFVESYVDEGISAKTTNRPAFQRLMRDIELGRIDTVMFTELSRLSRSLKDFLNIFEFAQRHACDLVCLKTEIDTTSPYQGLVTKILIVFSEFEREMTSRRTAINAYERSKRGLANGGQTLLGYRRDKKHKGRLLVEETEAEVVRAIFQTYAREKSIRRTTDRIKERFEGKSSRLKRITPGKIYGALTNKAYLAIREIYKRSKESPEEVPAAWPPIITERLFQKTRAILQGYKDRYHRRGHQRYLYLLSGLLICGKCGQKLQGKSAYSSSGKRHRYYAHRSTCSQDGLTRIDAEMAQDLVLSWLRNVASKGEKFRELEAQGKERIERQINEMKKEAGRLEVELSGVRKQIEARIQELTRARAAGVRESIEKSIVGLEEERKEMEGRRALVDHSIAELEGFFSGDRSLFADYRSRIQEVLKKYEDERKTGLAGLISSLLLQEGGIKIALSSVNQKALRSTAFVSAPPDKRRANGRPALPALIEATIPLPGLTLLRSKSYLGKLYVGRHLSARQIARLTDVSRSVVLEALDRFGIPRNGNGRRHPGQLPFGYEYLGYRLVENKTEQGVVRQIRQYRIGGLSLRQIAGQLNQRLIPTKNNGIWQATTVKGILVRA
jgi:site-specific DNA recombinase